MEVGCGIGGGRGMKGGEEGGKDRGIQYRGDFFKKHDVKLGFMSAIISVAATALARNFDVIFGRLQK